MIAITGPLKLDAEGYNLIHKIVQRWDVADGLLVEDGVGTGQMVIACALFHSIRPFLIVSSMGPDLSGACGQNCMDAVVQAKEGGGEVFWFRGPRQTDIETRLAARSQAVAALIALREEPSELLVLLDFSQPMSITHPPLSTAIQAATYGVTVTMFPLHRKSHPIPKLTTTGQWVARGQARGYRWQD